jgi:hypothetical protein
VVTCDVTMVTSDVHAVTRKVTKQTPEVYVEN